MTTMEPMPDLDCDWIIRILDAKEHELIMSIMMADHEWWYGVPVGPPHPDRGRQFIGLDAIVPPATG